MPLKPTTPSDKPPNQISRAHPNLPPGTNMAGSIGGRSVAANQRPGSAATFLVCHAPDLRITARSAGLHLDAALFRERVAAIALVRSRAKAFGLFCLAATCRVARAALALLGVVDARARQRSWVKEAGPRPRRRVGRFAGAARSQPRCQRGQRPKLRGYLRVLHVAMIPAGAFQIGCCGSPCFREDSAGLLGQGKARLQVA